MERAGRKPVLVKWEMSWPPTVRDGVQVEGTGPGVSNVHQIAGYHLFVSGDWKPRPVGGERDPETLDPSALQTVEVADPVRIKAAGSRNWKNLPESQMPPRAVDLTVRPLTRGRAPRGSTAKPKTYYGLAYASGGGGYDRLLVCRDRDCATAVAELSEGQWSEWWRDTFLIDGEEIDGYVQAKLVAMPPGLERFELFMPQIWPAVGYTAPVPLSRELDEEVGNFLQNPARDALGVVDDDTYFELLDFHHQRLADVAGYLTGSREWDILFIESHAPDYASHFFLAQADEVSGADPGTLARCREGLERTFASVDAMIGRVTALADDDTVCLVVSDHGGTPTQYGAVNVSKVLEETGFLTGKEGGGIDWERTIAADVGLVHIFINLEGREPTGIVAPEEYRQTQLDIIAALHGYVDEKTGLCPFALALTREDAEMVNLWGDLVGDVVYALRPEFDGAHGKQLPSASLGIGGQHCTFHHGRRRGAAGRRPAAPGAGRRRRPDHLLPDGRADAARRRGGRRLRGARGSRLAPGAVAPGPPSPETGMETKIYAYGMDGLITPMVKKFAAEGILPNFARMLAEGAVNQTAPSFPVWTPTNWATLSTGAHTGTHGATRWRVQLPDGERISSFDGRALSAERIWNALERAGLKSVAVHYPAADPSGVRNRFRRRRVRPPRTRQHRLRNRHGAGVHHLGGRRDGHRDGPRRHRGAALAAERAAGCAAAPGRGLDQPAAKQVAAAGDLHRDRGGQGGDVTELQVLVTDTGGNGYDRVTVCRDRDGGAPLAAAAAGCWSGWAIDDFAFGGGRQRASVRFKPVALSADGTHLQLYRSQVTFADGFTVPGELAAELVDRFGPYQEHASTLPYTHGMADFDTAMEECEYQGLWFADVANYMLREKDCSFFICHWHLFDYLNHIHLNDVDPACPGYDPARADEAMEMFRKAYQVGDRVLGRIWEAAGPGTYVSVLADHGAYPDVRVANIRKYLHDRGFTALKPGGGSRVEEDLVLEEDIDWERTRAYLKDDKGFDIYINAEPGEEFDRIERELLLALRTWVDEEVGGTPVAIALPKRDAYLLGQWGSQCGDVVFAWDHGYVSGYFGQWRGIVGGGAAGAPEVFGAHHGGFLPTRNDLSSSFGTMMIAGPGVRKGYERPVEELGYIHAVDVVATWCHLFGVEPPAHCQGAVARDLFES